MEQTKVSSNPIGREETKLETYRTAVKDARHIFNTYKLAHPDEAWETIRKIIFNPNLK